MSPEIFLDRFSQLAETPNGIKKLRELILQLAVQGKLVPQDPHDEPASVLLERIEAEKRRMVQAGDIKKGKLVPPVGSEEEQFDPPNGWVWTRLDAICSYIQRGKGPKYAEISDIPVISQKCVQWSGFDITRARFIDPDSLDKYAEERFLLDGDLLWNSTGTGTIGRVNIFQKHGLDHTKFVADSHVTVLRPLLAYSRYIWVWLASPYIQATIESDASGSTNQVELSTTKVKTQPIPLPPLAEQTRIVAKVDQLMALCDELEVKQKQRAETHAQVLRAVHHPLTEARTTTVLQPVWKRVRDHFDRLYITPDSAHQLRQTILQLAVQGKLVPQDPNDEPASVLLERIQAEKEMMFQEGKIRKRLAQKPAPIETARLPFLLPEGWVWTRLSLIAYQVTDGVHHTPNYVATGIPFLSVKDMSSGVLDFSRTRYISVEQHKELTKRCNPQRGDLLLTKVGTTGIPVLIDTETPFSIFVSVALIKYFSKYIEGKYLRLLINAPLVKMQSADGTEGVGNKNLVLRKISSFILPIPPHHEQCRIVAKVDQLMALCDELENRLKQSRTDGERLMESVIAHLAAA